MPKVKKVLLRPVKIIVLSCILALSLLGVGYAYWNDSLDTMTKLSMGSIKPLFSMNNCDFQQNNGSLNISVNDTFIDISGEIIRGDNYDLQYCIINEGTIPVKLNEQDIIKKLVTNNGIIIELENQFKILEPCAANTLYGELNINTENAIAGSDSFKSELSFKPSVGFGWKKKLIIKGEINVINPPPELDVNALTQGDTLSRNGEEEKETNDEKTSTTQTNTADTDDTTETTDTTETIDSTTGLTDTTDTTNSNTGNDPRGDSDTGSDLSSEDSGNSSSGSSSESGSDTSSDTESISSKTGSDSSSDGESGSDTNSDNGS